MKRILIIGANSYVGLSFKKYIAENYPFDYQIESISVRDNTWRNKDFSSFDVIINCVGIAHIKETKENSHLYYKVNRDLAIDLAKKAKADGVHQFILMSSIAVYGLITGDITKSMEPHPITAYAKSKLEADNEIRKIHDNAFIFTCIRPPMIYGKGCKGNYPKLERIVKISPVFPRIDNERSMIYIENLCEFIRVAIEQEMGGVYVPQNKEYVHTFELANLIAEVNRKHIIPSCLLGLAVKILSKKITIVQRAFTSIRFVDSDELNYSYCKYDLKESINRIYNHASNGDVRDSRRCRIIKTKSVEPEFKRKIKMGKKALLVTTISGFVPQFEMNSVELLQKHEYEVHYATNYNNVFYGKDNSRLDGTGIIRHQIDFARSPYSKQTVIAYKQLDRLINSIHFDVIHCHTPIGSFLARMCGSKNGVKKIIYTAHGFHFYKGAPFINQVVYRTAEKWMAHYTDALLTINNEDYKNAKKFRYKSGGRAYKIPGVGIDTKKFQVDVDRNRKREELGLRENDIVLLSVGELNKNKNHEIVIRAIGKIDNRDRIHYLICGEGNNRDCLLNLIKSLALEDHVHLLGFRNDVNEIYSISDLFLFPSLREGLPVSLMEAMAAGLPAIVSNARGNVDLVNDDDNGYIVDANNIDSWALRITEMIANEARRKEMGNKNTGISKEYDKKIVKQKLDAIYHDIGLY